MADTHLIEVIEIVWIPLPDGTKLAAKLWLPKDARSQPVPCILEYIPYRRRDRTRVRDASAHPVFAAAGYAALRVDQRGSGDSEGVMLDEYTDIETQDGVDVIAWIAAQTWCNGNVGMFGKSWGAYNSFQVAAKRPPALKAIAPVMGTDDRWLEDIHFYGGVLASDNFWWGAIMQLFNAMPPDPAIVGERWRDMWRDRLAAMTFWPAQWLEHQTHDHMWRRGSISEAYDNIDIPVYFFGGWADLYRDTPFRIAEHLRGRCKVLMGPWAHLYPHEGIPGPRIDFISELIRFWDHCLKGKDTGLMEEPALRFYLQDSASPAPHRTERTGKWVQEQTWPSPNVSTQALYLNSGMLGDKPQTGAAVSICSPQTFGQSAGDMMSFAIPGDLPGDCRIDAGGALSFVGPCVSEPVDILGQPQLNLWLSSDRAQGFVVGLLIDQSPDGAQTLITRGFANLMHRHSDIEPSPVNPGEKMQINVPLHGIGYCLAKGHRLVVQIASCYWPILWPAPKPVTLTLQPGQSKLHLPVRVAVEDQPRPMPEPANSQPAARATNTKPGSMERFLHTDLVSGEHQARVILDGGVFGPVGRIRLDDIGTDMGDFSDRIYRIHPEDPLMCHASMDQESHFFRDDWDVRIKTTAEMTADETHFFLKASVTCWDNEEEFHTISWDHTIPRNGM